MRVGTVLVTVTTAVVLAAGSGPAFADGPTVCVNGFDKNVKTAKKDGTCGGDAVATTLVTVDDLAAATERIATLENANEALQERVDTLEQKLWPVTYHPEGLDGKPTLRISGANLQVDNGTGSSRTTNGVGNVIVGYNETSPLRADPQHSGSHNLVLGYGHEFTSWGGLLGGLANAVHGAAGVAFGQTNAVDGDSAAVTGGFINSASGHATSVSGGFRNTASGDRSSVTGGSRNAASDDDSSVSGGVNNTASGGVLVGERRLEQHRQRSRRLDRLGGFGHGAAGSYDSTAQRTAAQKRA